MIITYRGELSGFYGKFAAASRSIENRNRVWMHFRLKGLNYPQHSIHQYLDAHQRDTFSQSEPG